MKNIINIENALTQIDEQLSAVEIPLKNASTLSFLVGYIQGNLRAMKYEAELKDLRTPLNFNKIDGINASEMTPRN